MNKSRGIAPIIIILIIVGVLGALIGGGVYYYKVIKPTQSGAQLKPQTRKPPTEKQKERSYVLNEMVKANHCIDASDCAKIEGFGPPFTNCPEFVNKNEDLLG